LACSRRLATAKFNETVEVAVKLGVDPRKSDQAVRGATTLPHGTGKRSASPCSPRVRRRQGEGRRCRPVGMDELAEQVKGGMMDFDVVVASPDAMRVVGQLGQILGPRGLMPNPKTGTVTPDVETAVKNAKAGQMRYPHGQERHHPRRLGKISFEPRSDPRQPRGGAGRPGRPSPLPRRACT
jgi:large subunit ribosomal protein L1